MVAPSTIRIAEVVCGVLGGASVASVMSDHRGSPRAADLRAVCWHVWRFVHKGKMPTFTMTAQAWGRDRRAIARGLQRIQQRGIPRPSDMRQIMLLLRGYAD